MRLLSSTRAINIFCAIVTSMLSLGLHGCGGGSSNALSSQATSRSGTVTFSVHWPATGRLVPAASQSVGITLSFNGQQIGQQVIARPTNGGVASASFSNVIAGTIEFTAIAYPNPNGTGTAQASGSSAVSVMSNSTSSVSLTMDNAIAGVSLIQAGITRN